MNLSRLVGDVAASVKSQLSAWGSALLREGGFPEYPEQGHPLNLSPAALDFPRAVASIPILYACINTLASDGASLPVRFYRVAKSGKRVPIVAEPGNVAWLWEHPNPNQSGVELRTELQADLDTGGNSYLFVETHGIEKPNEDWELWSMSPHEVRPVVGTHRARIAFKFSGGLGPVMLDASQVVFFRYWNPDHSPLGLSPLESARIQYEMRYHASLWGRQFYKSGGNTSAIFSIDGGAQVADQTIDAWQRKMKERYTGWQKVFDPVFLRGVKLEQRGMSLKDMQFIETAGLADADICRILDIPPVIMGIKLGGGLSDAGAAADLVRYWEFAQMKRATLRDAVVNHQLCPRFGRDIVCETDLSRVPALQARFLEQIKGLVIATGRPIMTANEGRLPIAWLDPVQGDETADALYVPRATSPLDGSEHVGSGDVEPKRMRERSAPRVRTPERRRASALLALYERKLARRYRMFLREQEDRALAKLEILWGLAGHDMGRNGVHRLRRDLGSIDWLQVVDAGGEDDHAAIEKIFSDLIAERGEQQLAELGMEMEIEMGKERVAQFADRYAGDLIGNTSDTTREAVRDALVEVIERGGSYNDAVSAVKIAFDGRRGNAETIARTEMAGAYNFASMDAARQSGVVESKAWFTAEDELVREAHRVAEEGGPISLDDSWIMESADGSVSVAFPGDPDAPPELKCNCRCTMQFVVNEERRRSLKTEFAARRSVVTDANLKRYLEGLCRPSLVHGASGTFR